MKRTVLLIVAAIALLISMVAALAATDSENPNDPAINPNANACYTGGSMAGKCKLDDELWIAGWYEIRLESGIISREQVPDAYKWLIAPDNLADSDKRRLFPTAVNLPPTATPLPTLQ